MMGTPPLPLPSTELASALGVYVTAEDSLRITSWNATTGAAIQIAGRLLSDGAGGMRPFAFTQAMLSTGAPLTTEFPLEAGWIQSLAVANVGLPVIGQTTLVRVEVVRGKGPGAVILAVLAQGLLTADARLAYPGFPVGASGAGSGRPQTRTGVNPAAGAEILELLPGGRRYRLQAVTFTLVTDATVADREVSLIIDNGPTVMGVFPSGVVQPASTARQYTAAAQGVRGASALGADILIAIPSILLLGGYHIGTRTINRQAGDDFSSLVYSTEETLDM